jgi:hypothetical protein
VREILVIARYRWRGVRNDLAQRPGQRALACLLIVLNLLGAYLAYQGFVRILEGWSWSGDRFPSGSILLLLLILGLAYLLSLVSAAKEFLAHAQTPLLLATPIRPSSLLWAKYLAVLADRNLELAVVVLGMPCLLAMHRMGLAQAFYLFPPFFAGVLLAGMSAVATVLTVARYAWQRRRLAFGAGTGLLIVLLAWIAWAISADPANSVPGAALESLQRWQIGSVSKPLLMSATSTLALLFVLWGLAWLSGRIYAPAWSRLQETRLVKPEPAQKPRRQVFHRLSSSWQGTTWAILLKDWRTMGRSPLFPVRGLGLLLSWVLFVVVREHVDTQDPWMAVPVVVAYVLLSLQVTLMELAANAFAGEGNRLSLILTAPLSPGQLVRAKWVTHLAPALLAGAVSAAIISTLASLPPFVLVLTVLLVWLITAANVALLVGGSVVATDLSAGVSGALEEILFEETSVAPVAAARMALTGVSVAFQALTVAVLFLPYWWEVGFGSSNGFPWGGLVAAFLILNGAVAFGALRAGVVGLGRLTG